MKKDAFKSILVLTGICLIVAVLLSTANAVTKPIIDDAERAATNTAFQKVLPDATGFEELETDGLPETVSELYKDEGGSGYAMKLTTKSSYSQSPLVIVLGIDKDGQITTLSVVNYAETKEVGDAFYEQFSGKDAALDGVDITAGATYSSKAIIGAVEDAYTAFAAIQKSDGEGQ